MKTYPSVNRVSVGGTQASDDATRRTRRRSLARPEFDVGMRSPSKTIGEDYPAGMASRMARSEPAVLVRQSHVREVLPDPCRGTLGKGGLDRMSLTEGHGERDTDAGVLLAVGVGDAVELGLTAGVPRAVHGQPQPGAEGVRDVALQGHERILRTPVAAEEVVVDREEPDARIELEGPLAGWPGEAELGLERPAVGADVDELVAEILAGRHQDHETPAERGLERRAREFGRR